MGCIRDFNLLNLGNPGTQFLDHFLIIEDSVMRVGDHQYRAIQFFIGQIPVGLTHVTEEVVDSAILIHRFINRIFLEKILPVFLQQVWAKDQRAG